MSLKPNVSQRKKSLNKLKAQIKLFLLNEENTKVFGEGAYRLLCGVKETGSLRRSAISMGMAYTKAHKSIKAAEEALGIKLLIPTIGGKTGGGSILTPECEELLEKYEEYKSLVNEANQRIYNRIFGISLTRSVRE